MDIIRSKKNSPARIPRNPEKKLIAKPEPRKQLGGINNIGLLESPVSKNQTLIAWEAPEFVYYKKTSGWYAIMGLVGIILTIYAIATKNPIMAITFGLIFIVIFVYAEKKPLLLKFGITPKGIKVQDRIYYFDYLESFWIFYDPPLVKTLSVKSRKVLMPLIKIPLGKANPLEARKILLKYLEEKEQRESLIDVIARIIRF